MTDPIIKRGPLRSTVGVEVDALDLTLLTNADVVIQGVPLAQFARAGGFDGARVQLDRYFAANWHSAPAGNLTLFAGRVSELDASGTEVHMSVKSDLELLNTQMPRNLYMAQCAHALYSTGCTLSAATWTATGEATGGTARAIATDLAQADGYFNLGTVKFLTGANAGLTRTVRGHTGGVLTVSYPLPFDPAPGDEIEARPGCDKLKATCNTKFSNAVNFRGFPFIPAPETSY